MAIFTALRVTRFRAASVVVVIYSPLLAAYVRLTNVGHWQADEYQI